MTKMLNIGCGRWYHSDWINIDLAPAARDVIACDLRERLRFDTGSFDVVYHSHVLEHFTREEGKRFMQEVARVLRPGGILRVVVPDLETIVLLYIEKLTAVLAGEMNSLGDYEWILIELLDQMTRQKTGGLMAQYLSRCCIPNESFVRERIGELDAVRTSQSIESTWQKIVRIGPRGVLARVQDRAAQIAVALVGGQRAVRRYDMGKLHDSGELHKWMYDRYSLAQLMEQVGIGDVTRRDAFTSVIAGFDRYGLDATGGKPRKPDSLYMEGVRAA